MAEQIEARVAVEFWRNEDEGGTRVKLEGEERLDQFTTLVLALEALTAELREWVLPSPPPIAVSQSR